MPFTILMSDDEDTRKTDFVYKGKSSKYWPHLPYEVIRLIATFHLLNTAATSLAPAAWDHPQYWPSRLIFSLLRNALEMERLMQIYPSWGAALETHLFWRQACTMIDPQDSLIHNSIQHPTPTAGSTAPAAPYRLTPYRHFRNITTYSCLVCRVNAPLSTNGLSHGKWAVPNPFLGPINTCKEHRRIMYCGICLKEAPVIEGELEYAQGLSMCCVENEDDQMWPGIESTCRNCRCEGLWRFVEHSPIDREAIGGQNLMSDDWETRQAVEAFVDLGEGTMSEVLAIARDKYWYKVNTKLPDMLSQAIAASRYGTRSEIGYGSEEDASEEEEEEDAEMLSMTEDAAGIRDIAVTDYIRGRILDGYWVNPADVFYDHTGCKIVVPAQHPCPWNPGAVFDGALEEGEAETADGEELQHPRPKTVQAMPPPSETLSSMTYQAFMKQMKDIVSPAMHNIVRRLVIESAADGRDPSIPAAAMSLDDVAEALRDEAVWFTGIDWLERRANAREQEREQRGRDREKEKDEDDSSSSRSGGSHMTSPVLSTTTLQTTPSPPPSGSSSAKDDDTVSSPITSNPPVISVSPVLKSPQMLHPIPYVPLKVSSLPAYSHDAFKYAWRDACAPLFECYCSICERRILKQNAAASAGAANSNNARISVPPQKQKGKEREDAPVQPPLQIKVPEVPVEMLRAEEEEGESEAEDRSAPEPLALPRKRPSRELDVDAFAETTLTSNERGGSPPKRLRTDGTYSPAPAVPLPSPPRLRKRSSEELEDGEEKTIDAGGGEAKRMRGDPEAGRPASYLPLPRKAHSTAVVGSAP